jgi:hypothetical protein
MYEKDRFRLYVKYDAKNLMWELPPPHPVKSLEIKRVDGHALIIFSFYAPRAKNAYKNVRNLMVTRIKKYNIVSINVLLLYLFCTAKGTLYGSQLMTCMAANTHCLDSSVGRGGGGGGCFANCVWPRPYNCACHTAHGCRYFWSLLYLKNRRRSAPVCSLNLTALWS